ncbi:xanthine dehydrogenase subunit E [Paenibacillus sp. FSL A5-0031]|uniref:(2Fe-2S)-binding protein n=1 Tax=Paenibacillus sp. FSL A5-0031 TaxID=1920420 RepID=UPI00096F6EA0|nr:2Fe-2S iron-sulfur cluster-binding protein [Paenibacillus sp. FSL A5-0031]OME80175.1 xanthine dehydrogenase subunit E [Paenibacillus sp. FSL A5-0031]
MSDHTAKVQTPFALECFINEQELKIETAASTRLLTILRDDLALTGTKRSCDIGRCGACMVLIDGQAVNSCLTMAYQCTSKRITTIEGISSEGIDPIGQAFLEEGGFQCGYCTPGMIVSVKSLLDHQPEPSDDEIAEALSGNSCRCTGYGGIWRAVKRAIEGRRQAI